MNFVRSTKVWISISCQYSYTPCEKDMEGLYSELFYIIILTYFIMENDLCIVVVY